jgi:hypothetical protein
MGTVLEFPGEAIRRLGSSTMTPPLAEMGTVLILPVVRIERTTDGPTGHSPEGSRNGGRRRGRARS